LADKEDKERGIYKREGAGRESMEGWQIKKLRKGEYRKGKGWSSVPLHT